jgi:hypothetical protein
MPAGLGSSVIPLPSPSPPPGSSLGSAGSSSASSSAGTRSAQTARSGLVLRGLTLCIGLDLAVALLVVPGAYLGLLPGDLLLGGLLVAAIALLAGGIARRSPRLLLLGYPALLIAPVALRPDLCSPTVYRPAVLVPAAAALCAYLVCATLLCRDDDAPTAVVDRVDVRRPNRAHAHAHAHATSGTPRAARLARWLALRGAWVAAVAIPLAVTAALTLSPSVEADLRLAYPGQAQRTRAALLLGVLVLELGLAGAHVVRPLLLHSEGDRDLADSALFPSRFLQGIRRRWVVYGVLLAALVAGLVITSTALRKWVAP